MLSNLMKAPIRSQIDADNDRLATFYNDNFTNKTIDHSLLLYNEFDGYDDEIIEHLLGNDLGNGLPSCCLSLYTIIHS